ncbi:MAG: LpxD N-terminal domain-containing protein [Planctomycetota bacterium]
MKKLNLAQVAALCGGQIEGPDSGSIRGVASLEDAGPDEAAFLADPRYRGALGESQAGCVLVGTDLELPRGERTLLRCADPSAAFTKLVEHFAPVWQAPLVGVHATSHVHETARIDPSASIGPFCHVGPHARIGPRCVLVSHVSVGEGVSVGHDCELYPRWCSTPGSNSAPSAACRPAA